MTDKIIMVPLKDIQPLYPPLISNTFQYRMQMTINHLQMYDLILPVERHEKTGMYQLVGGYDKYVFLKNQGVEKAPCLVEKYTGPVQQYLKSLRRLHHKGDSTMRNNKLKILSKLSDLRISFKTIMKNTGFKKSELQMFRYDPNIPNEYISHSTSTKTMNWIAKNKAFSPYVKMFLYKRAHLDKGHPQRLTEEKAAFIEYILKKVNNFERLTESQQIKVLKRCISFKGEFSGMIQKMIDDFLTKKD